MSVVLVVAPHPDDETLGCGGTLLRHAAEGDEIHWLIMTEINQQLGYSVQQIATRKEQIKQVASEYNFKQVYFGGFSTTELDTYPKSNLVGAVSRAINSAKANILYTPYRLDVHSDHTAVFDAVASCSKTFRHSSVTCVRAYETLSETAFSLRPEDGGFKPNLFVNIDAFLDRKVSIMQTYSGEIAEHPFPRSEKSIRALAVLRGCTAGVEAAEAFMTLKETI